MIFKNPRYFLFATGRLTGTVYSLPPIYRRGGKLTKACTEITFPELSFVKTQKGVPTVSKTLLRTHLFAPEYLATSKSISRGALSRLFKWAEPNKSRFKWNTNAPAIMTFLNRPQYADWFASSKSMITGHLYDGGVVDSLSADANGVLNRYVPILGRIIDQELT